MQLKFKLFDGEEQSHKITKKSCVIGRSSQCDVVIPHEGMSRKHCMLTSRNGTLYVTDLGSTNGVYLDGQKIEPNKETAFPTYLSISFGFVQNLNAELDESDAVDEELPKSTPQTPDPGLTTTRTKPLTLDKKSKKQNMDSKQLLLALVIVALALAFYFLTQN